MSSLRQAKSNENSPPGPPLAAQPRRSWFRGGPQNHSSRSCCPPSPTASAEGPARGAHSFPTRNRNWPVGGTRAMASGRGQVGRRSMRPPPSPAGQLAGWLAGWLARPLGPQRKGPAPHTPAPPPDQPRRRRGRPPRPGAESRLLHRPPPPPPSSGSRSTGTVNRSARLPRASKTTIRKWLQLNCLSAPLLRECHSAGAAGGGGQVGGSRSGARGSSRPPSPCGRRHNSAPRGDAGNPPAPSKPVPPAARTHRVSCLRVHLAQVANHPNRFSWLRWAEARGSLALMAPRRRQRRPAGSEGLLGRSRPPPGLA